MWVCLFLLILSFYLHGLCPTVYFQDSPELVSSAITLDICHPPGYPLWTLLGAVMARVIPFGEYAFRVNLGSALPFALASVLWGRLAKALVRTGGPLVGLVAALGAAFATRTWAIAESAEVHGLSLLLLSMAVGVALEVRNRPRDLVAWAFVAGLSLSNHQSSALLFLILFVWMLAQTKGRILTPGLLVRSGAMGVLGLSCQAYLSLAADRGPLYNWGNPSTLKALWAHVSRQQYGELALPASFPLYLEQLKLYGKDLFQQLPLCLLLLSVLGVLWFLRRWRRSGSLILPLFVASSVIFVWFSNPEVTEWYPPIARMFFIPSFFLVALASAVGLSELSRWRPLAMGLSLCLGAWIPLQSLAWATRRDTDLARRFGALCLKEMPRRAAFFTTMDNVTFTCRYLAQVEGLRSDVDLVSRNGLVAPEFRARLAEQHPDWTLPSEPEVLRIQEASEPHPGILLSPGQEMTPGWLGPLLERVIASCPPGKPIGWEAGGGEARILSRLDQRGIVCLVAPHPVSHPEGPRYLREAPRLLREIWSKGPQIGLDHDVTFAFATKYNDAASLADQRGEMEASQSFCQMALKVNPHHATAKAQWAQIADRQGRRQEAEEGFLDAVSWDPLNQALLTLHASFLKEQGRDKEARKALEKILRISPSLIGPSLDLLEIVEPSVEREKLLRSLLARAERREDAAFIIGRRALALEDTSLLEQCRALWPESPRLQMLGYAAAEEKNPQEALLGYQRLVQSRPSDPEAWMNLGRCLGAQGQFEPARDAYAKAVSLRGIGAEAGLGKCLLMMGRPEEAWSHLDKGSQEAPRDPEVWLNLGIASGQMNRFEQAEQALRKASSLDPSSDSATLNLAFLYSQKGDLQEAIKILEQALTRVERTNEIQSDLAHYRESLKRTPALPMLSGH